MILNFDIGLYIVYTFTVWRLKLQAVIQKWGNSLGIRIPAVWAKENDISNGSEVDLLFEDGKLVIVPKKKSLEEMMKLVTAENLHSEVQASGPVGNEEW